MIRLRAPHIGRVQQGHFAVVVPTEDGGGHASFRAAVGRVQFSRIELAGRAKPVEVVLLFTVVFFQEALLEKFDVCTIQVRRQLHRVFLLIIRRRLLLAMIVGFVPSGLVRG